MIQKRKGISFPKRGEIFLINFDPALGSEIKKTRPALILQNDIGNEFSPVTIVAAITSHVGERRYPTEIFLPKELTKLSEDSIILLNQIRTIDKIRLIQRMGILPKNLLEEVRRALMISFGLVEI